MRDMQIKRKTWYDKKAVSRKFKVGDQVLALATSKVNKLAVTWIGPGVVTGKISDTNYVVGIPERRDRATIYHVNMLKPYHKRPERINLLLLDEREEVEQEVEIPYLFADPTRLNFDEIVRSRDLEVRASVEQIERLGRVLTKYGEVFSANPGSTP